MPRMIDLEDLQRSLEAMKERQGQRASLPDPDGVVARMQVAVIPATATWQAQEINRDTPRNMIGNAIIGLCTSLLAGFVASVHYRDPDAQFALFNKMLHGIGEEVGATLTGQNDAIVHTIKKIDGGRA